MKNNHIMKKTSYNQTCSDIKIANMNYYFNVDYYSFIIKNKKIKLSDLTPKENEPQDVFEIGKRNNMITSYKFSNIKPPKRDYTQKIILTIDYPGLLMGIGNNHEVGIAKEINLGFTFDYVTGLPYLPGSSLKGIISSAFKNFPDFIIEQLHDNEIVNSLNDKDDLVKRIKEAIFGSDNDLPGSDVFMDSFVVSNDKQLLKLDHLAPHYGDDKLLEMGNINILTMLRVAPETKIKFEFILKDSELEILDKCYKITVAEKLKLFEQIIKEFGVGAKTNVGYGYFKGEEVNG
ncbi:MAG: type III-B CRISPR module RAMP protein Cmr6 [Thomasclavelia spiroformis]